MLFSFRKLSKQDFKSLFLWLNKPHVMKFYQREAISLDEIETRYAPRLLGASAVKSHVAVLEGTDIGYLQCYLNKSDPKYVEAIGYEGGVSIDLFIGDETYLGKGLGSKMLQNYIRQVVCSEFPDEESVFICHNQENKAVNQSIQKIGFQFVKNVCENNAPSTLMRLNRKT